MGETNLITGDKLRNDQAPVKDPIDLSVGAVTVSGLQLIWALVILM